MNPEARDPYTGILLIVMLALGALLILALIARSIREGETKPPLPFPRYPLSVHRRRRHRHHRNHKHHHGPSTEEA